MSKLSWLFGRAGSKTSDRSRQDKSGGGRRNVANLLRRAGYADEPAFEQLEERKLMFNLVVNPADPTFVDLGGGIGQVTADFGYVAPFLNREVPPIQALPSDTVTYDQVGLGNVATGTILRPQQNNPFGFRITHTGFNAGQVRVISIGQAPADTPRALAADITNTTSRLNFEALNGTVPRLMQMFAFTTTGTGGFNAGSQIELIRGGVVQQTLNFAAINATAVTDPQTGNITYTVGTPGGVVFDMLRISRTAAGTTSLRLIATNPIYPGGRFGEFLEGLTFGARMVLTGRIGTTANVVDLYGRDMTRTLALGRTADNPTGVALVDLNDDGVPDFNDGIGRIVLSNTDSSTQLLITGGTVQAITTLEEFQGADATEEAASPPALNPNNFFGLYLPGNPVGGGGGGGNNSAMSGLAGFFDAAGFGFAFDNQGDIVGMGNTIGSVLIGSPFIRDNSSPVTYHGVDPADPTVTQAVPSTLPQVRPQQIPTNPTPGNFPLADVQPGNPGSLSFSSMLIENNLAGGVPNPLLRQGIFAANTVGDIYVNGMLFGSSQFDETIGNFGVGTLYGSMRVEGDAHSLYVGSDAGTFISFRNGQLVPVATGSQIVFGRNVGNITIGATNRATFQILGDVLNPGRAVGDFLTYAERENVIAVDPQAQNQEYTLQGSLSASGPYLFDGQTYRNDGIVNAEFIGSGLRGAVISGTLGQLNGQPDEDTAGEDAADVFAFAAQAGTTIDFSVLWNGTQFPDRNYTRVVDAHGNVLAAHQFPFVDRNSAVNGADNNAGRFSFTPTSTGVYYLVLGSQINGQNPGAQPDAVYQVTMTGQMQTTLGSFTVAGGNRADFLRVVNGNVGLVRYGSGVQLPNGDVRISPQTSIDVAGDVLEQADVGGSVLSVGGDLYEAIFGGTIVGITMNVGRDLGVLRTGFNIGDAGEQGDLQAGSISVGRSIGAMFITGSIGYQTQATTNRQAGAKGPISITVGSVSQSGAIGEINVGNLINGEAFTVVMPGANSVVERLTLGTISGGPQSGQFVRRQPTFAMGAGSDIRFTEFTQTPYVASGQPANPDLFIPLTFNQPIVVTDDNGAQVQILVTGGTGSAGRLEILPFNGPSSGPIGFIFLTTFNANSNLIITAQAAGTSVDIGNIAFGPNAIGGAGANIRLQGPGTVNVHHITANNVSFGEISNNSPGGDIVNATVNAVNRVILTGNLGFTEYVSPHRTDFLEFNTGQTRLPVRWIESDEATDEDLGAPDLTNINGLFVLGAGTTALVSVNGRLGDVITAGTLRTVTANADAFTPSGEYNGIEGVIFASANIGTVDVGDGVRRWGDSPFANAGIFAVGHIGLVSGGSRVRNPVINGPIIASGAGTPLAGYLPGISAITLTSGLIDNAYIGGSGFGDAWSSVRFTGVRTLASLDPPGATTIVNNITLSNATMSRTTLFALAFRSISITGGSWDANNLEARAVAGQAPIAGLTSGDIISINADRFINSTVGGEPLEYRFNQIRAGRRVTSLRVNNPAVGDFSDINLDIVESLTSISARNFTRITTRIGTGITSLVARGDIRGSIINAGRFVTASVANIRQSTFNISGPITSIVASGSITDSVIISDGPNGAITSISATDNIDALISSSGAISSIRAARGDIAGLIRTTDASDGTVSSIYAGRDMNAAINVVRDVGVITAVRNIGRRLADGTTPDTIDIRGNLTSLTASGGTIYSDTTVGGSIIGSVLAGRAAFALPTNDWVSDARITAAGRIASISWTGDFAGVFRSNSGGIASIRITNGSLRGLGRDLAGNPINSIEVFDGDLTSLVISRGHLLGSVAVPNGSISVISVTGDATYGNIGISPGLTTAGVVAGETGRRQLPPNAVLTAGMDGPTIFAGRDITSIVTTGGIFESSIIAGRNLGSVVVSRGVDNIAPGPSANSGSFIIAGDAITSVIITQGATNLFVGAGVTALGADLRPGGIGADADTNRSGTIGSFRAANTSNVTIVAGIVADAAGSYTGANATVANGLSTITSVVVPGVNTATNTFVRADTQPTAAAIVLNGAGNTVDGGLLAAADPRVVTTTPGVTIAATGTVITVGAAQARVFISGPGQAFYDQATRRITLRNTTAGSVLRIDPLVAGTPVTLTGLVIRSFDDSSLAFLQVSPNVTLSGATDIYVDGNIAAATFQALQNVTGVIETGGNLTTLTVGAAAAGVNQVNSARIVSQNMSSATFYGTFGNGSNSGLTVRNISSFFTTGGFGGRLSSDFDITSARVTSDFNGGIRAGYNIGVFTGSTMTNARLVAGGNISSISTVGTALTSTGVTGSFIGAGVDLGRDTAFGGTGVNADVLSDGNITYAVFGGNFTSSDIAAGVLRGASSQFIGTTADRIADGRSTIGPVTIRGNQVGSALLSQSFRITSNGTVGAVTVGTQTNFQFAGNFRVATFGVQPDPLVVNDLVVSLAGGVYQARLTFNQGLDFSSLQQAGALVISEIRGAEPIATSFALVEGTDYVTQYDGATSSIIITFNTAVTSRALVAGAPPAANLPNAAAPGIYRFVLDASLVRAQSTSARLDGNGDGVAGDNFSYDSIVGDAGDRFATFQNGPGNDPTAVNFYTPVDLNLLMDFTQASNSPSINRPFTVRGILGDLPAVTSGVVGASSDVDLYTISLQAGQILRLGDLLGAAAGATVTVLTTTGADPIGNGSLLQLPSATGQTLLVQQAGTYALMVAVAPDPFLANSQLNPAELVIQQGDLVNIPPIAGAVGDYAFTVTVSDDSDTGFAGTLNNNGLLIGQSPLPSAFKGPVAIGAGRPQAPDDLPFIDANGFRWTLEGGANNLINGDGTALVRSDDVVRGINTNGVVIERRAGADGRFTNAPGSDDIYSVQANIGDAISYGGATFLQSDVDVFHLNNGQTITPGSRYRVTMRVSEMAYNLGLIPPAEETYAGILGSTVIDTRGQIQLAIFDTSGATTLSDASLVAAPQGTISVGGTPNTVLGDSGDGVTTYGYDSRGDFYIEFTAPPRQDNTAQDGTFAVVVQGVNRTRYTLEVIQRPDAVPAVPAEVASQNFYIELNGASINWLEAGGRTTLLSPFTADVNGFQGTFGGLTPADYIRQNYLQQLRDMFAAIPGFTPNTVDGDGTFGTIGTIRISTVLSDFDGQDYSTIYIAGNNPPPAFVNNGELGYSQRVDAFNANHNDQAVIFAPTLNPLGNNSSQVGIDNFVRQLSAATAQRMGELLGVRLTGLTGAAANTDVMAVNSPALTLNAPAQQFRFVNTARNLAGTADGSPVRMTDFFLGRENDQALLQRIFAVP